MTVRDADYCPAICWFGTDHADPELHRPPISSHMNGRSQEMFHNNEIICWVFLPNLKARHRNVQIYWFDETNRILMNFLVIFLFHLVKTECTKDSIQGSSDPTGRLGLSVMASIRIGACSQQGLNESCGREFPGSSCRSMVQSLSLQRNNLDAF